MVFARAALLTRLSPNIITAACHSPPYQPVTLPSFLLLLLLLLLTLVLLLLLPNLLYSDRGKGATHGLGIAFGVYALGNSAGDIIGGSLTDHHRGAACLVSASFATASLLSLALFGWKETAPPLVGEGWRRRLWWRTEEQERVDGAVVGINDDDVAASRGNGGRDFTVVRGGDAAATASVDSFVWDDDGKQGAGGSRGTRRSARKELNPLTVLKVFMGSRCVVLCACVILPFRLCVCSLLLWQPRYGNGITCFVASTQRQHSPTLAR